MSLRFYFGPSGSGKSRGVYEEMIKRAGENPAQQFLIVVPDQFTMQTQKDLVTMTESGGIMNIDVLSFGRLNHRIMEEVGSRDLPVLDDTGKCLVLQKCASEMEEELPVLGGLLKRQGYIHEAKSAISEFMQYGITVDDIPKLLESAKGRGALTAKLKDLGRLYKAFQEYIDDSFLTREESLDVLRESLCRSKVIKDSVVVFDGFTGFTPVQNKVIQEIMRLAAEVVVTLDMGAEMDPYLMDGEQKLFYMSKKTAFDLCRLAEEIKVPRGTDVVLTEVHRFEAAEDIAFLESNLFRFNKAVYPEVPEHIHISEVDTLREEVRQAGLQILKLVRERDYCYRDFAVIAGNMEKYAPYIENEFDKLGIPLFMDSTRGLVLNPMVECISSVLNIYLCDFSYDSMFHYLRCGLSDISTDDVDLLDNYVRQAGIRGYKKWNKAWAPRKGKEECDENLFVKLNSIREAVLEQIAMPQFTETTTAGQYVEALVDHLIRIKAQQKLYEYEKKFEAAGELSKAREYAQVFRLICRMLETIHQLIGDEVMPLKEFREIVEAGFGEIKVGTIPQNVDRVLAGDVERTRLKQIKVLMFLGADDSNIPKSSAGGGIISDMDREFLCEQGIELAPSPRQKMYSQRLYLYMNMTKPEQELFLSYPRMDAKGGSVRPSYLISTLKTMYPELKVGFPHMRPAIEQIETEKEGLSYLARELRQYAEGSLNESRMTEFYTIYSAYEGREGAQRLTETAFKQYVDSGLSEAVAKAIYGQNLANSITRMERYSSCAYAHFLKYGLGLQEREEFDFQHQDIGTAYHEVFQKFGERLEADGRTWFDFTEEYAEKAVEEILSDFAVQHGNAVLLETARSQHLLRRITNITRKNIMTLQGQLRSGHFKPSGYEVSFGRATDPDKIDIALSESERIHLIGSIDRVDTYTDADHVYVKIIDYKSGSRDFDIAALYYGLQLQLVVYMEAAMVSEKRKNPGKEVIPAAMLYYHVYDPVVDGDKVPASEDINDSLRKMFKMKGVVNSDEAVYRRIDAEFENASDIIPVKLNKDGNHASNSSVLDTDQFKLLSDFVNAKIKTIGQEIFAGRITADPYTQGSGQFGKDACRYCAFKGVCGFDESLGYHKRELEDLSQEEVLERMEQECQ